MEVIYSDAQADSGGNSERLAFLYDTRAVTFTAAYGDIPEIPVRNSGILRIIRVS